MINDIDIYNLNKLTIEKIDELEITLKDYLKDETVLLDKLLERIKIEKINIYIEKFINDNIEKKIIIRKKKN